MVYEITVESSFVARHGIELPNGTVEPAHEHDWHVTARFVGSGLDSCGLLVDFDVVKAALDAVLAPLRGADLNHAPALDGLNPTAEFVARTIFEDLFEKCGRDERLFSVTVTEAPGCSACYRRPHSS
jgi:6-pyruvoyltetrahydropterin/6-carboxytetrahydropterin synthase